MTIPRNEDQHRGKGDVDISPIPRAVFHFEGDQARATHGGGFINSSDTEDRHPNGRLEDASKNRSDKSRVPYSQGIDIEINFDNEGRCMNGAHGKRSKDIFDFLFTDCDGEHNESEDDSICITRNRLARRRSSLDHCRQTSENVKETELKGLSAE
jgi:hypothetical protein